MRVHLCALKVIPKITTMTSDSGVEIRSGVGGRDRRGGGGLIRDMFGTITAAEEAD